MNHISSTFSQKTYTFILFISLAIVTACDPKPIPKIPANGDMVFNDSSVTNEMNPDLDLDNDDSVADMELTDANQMPFDSGLMLDDAGQTDHCFTVENYLTDVAWTQVFSQSCIACHRVDGAASQTRMVFENLPDPNSELDLISTLEQVTTVIEERERGIPLLLLKPLGLHPNGHGGGLLFSQDSSQAQVLIQLSERVLGIRNDCGMLTAGAEAISLELETEDCGELEPGRRMLRRLSHQEYQNTIYDLLGLEFDAEASFAADNVEYGFDNHPERLDTSALLLEQYRESAEQLASVVNLTLIVDCPLNEGSIQCAHQMIVNFGLKAYRRPLTHTEVEQYLNIYRLVTAQSCFEEALRWIITAMLQSPHFLYRSELGRRIDDHFELSPYELATALSYLFWETMPDEELFRAAASGELLETEQLNQQVQRLVNHPRNLKTARRFFYKWLSLDRLMQVVRDAEIYAALYFELREMMLEETGLLLDELWSDNANFSELFLSPHTWINESLAEYYELDWGEPHPEQVGFYRADISNTRPGGILTHGSFLTTHASPTSSSPIHRGVMIRERLLCDHLDPPPEGLDVTPPEFDPNLSTRERFAAHTADPQCASCHRLIDPVGFGFENYDGIGRYRENDGGEIVDSSGSLLMTSGDEYTFNGLGELASLLAHEEQVESCYAQQWLRFGFGETEGLDVSCYVKRISERSGQTGAQLRSALVALTTTPHFTTRFGETQELDAVGIDYVPARSGVAPVLVVEDSPTLEEVQCGEAPETGGSANVNDARILVSERLDSWETGYCIYVSLQNTTAEVLVGWAVELQVDGLISNAWNVERSADSGLVTFTPLSWNSEIQANATIEFGFCGSY